MPSILQPVLEVGINLQDARHQPIGASRGDGIALRLAVWSGPEVGAHEPEGETGHIAGAHIKPESARDIGAARSLRRNRDAADRNAATVDSDRKRVTGGVAIQSVGTRAERMRGGAVRGFAAEHPD